MTPQEKTQQLLEAIRFCKEHNLFFPKEVQKAVTKEQQFRLGCEAILRKEHYLKAHPEEK